jgi:uncharacterized protein YggE
MKKIWLVAVGVVVIMAAVFVTGCSSEGAKLTTSNGELKLSLNNQQEGIWVNGEGKVVAVPDVAILRLGIEAQGASVAEAQDQAREAMDKVMKALKDEGIAEKDIQTQYFNINRITRWDDQENKEVITGYQVTNMVTAKIRDVTKAGDVIDVVAAAGGDYTRIDSIGFTVDDPSGYQKEAREQAVADAEAKAKQLAEAAGIKLGKPLYITESSYTPGPVYRQDMVMKAEAAPAVETAISPGEQEITVNVQISYAIED